MSTEALSNDTRARPRARLANITGSARLNRLDDEAKASCSPMSLEPGLGGLRDPRPNRTRRRATPFPTEPLVVALEDRDRAKPYSV